MKPTEGPYTAWFTDVPYAEFNGAAWTVQSDIGSVCVVDCPKDEAAATARLLAKSWEMREMLERLTLWQQNIKNVAPVELDGCIATMSDARALLREIDGDDE